jgi:hypothetical protein
VGRVPEFNGTLSEEPTPLEPPHVVALANKVNILMEKSITGVCVVTPNFKAKTECIPLCVPGLSFTHKVTNSEINSIISVYCIVSYYKKNLLQVQNGLSSGKDTMLPHEDDREPTCLEEVFIK